MTVVVGTAGHIDHGKTSLLRALTGIDADRLPEERRRGMTIDVGYAHLALPDGTELDFVDVPGHDRLIGNMLVGAGEIDAVMLVVAADDGPRAQTLEHLELLDGLGIRDGIAVVTKLDALPPDDPRRSEVLADVVDLLARTTLAGSRVLAASSVTGEGIDEVRAALVRLSDRVLARAEGRVRPVRLPIDRAFAVRGRGTVVTGTLRGGPLQAGRALRIEPGAFGARIRGLEVHGRTVDGSPVSGRVAVNVAGVEPDVIHRGAVLTDGASVVASGALLVGLVRPAQLGPVLRPWPIPAGTTLRLHLGTEQVDARVRRSRRESLGSGSETDIVRLVLERSIAVAAADRFVLRQPSPGWTAAGGVVLDTAPPTGISRRRASPDRLRAVVETVVDSVVAADGTMAATDRAVAALVDLHGVLPSHRADEIAGALGVRTSSTPPGTRMLVGHLIAEDVAGALAEAATSAVASPQAPNGVQLAELRRSLAASLRRLATVTRQDAHTLASALVDNLVSAGRLARDGDLVRDPSAGHGPSTELAAAMDRLETALSVASPPSLSDAALAVGCPPEGIRALESAGRLVRLEDDLAWSFATYRDLAALALRMADPGPLSPAAFRDATGSSRRYVLTVLEDLDRRGLLRRTPDGHVLGPRAPRAATT